MPATNNWKIKFLKVITYNKQNPQIFRNKLTKMCKMHTLNITK